jgi:hypothetical protein
MPDYKVFVVDQEGTPYAGSGVDDEVPNARLSAVATELNEAGGVTVTLATTDPDAALFQTGREVQVFVDGITNPVFWGVIVRPQAGLDESSWQCAGLLWYFAHRHMGRADRVNQLTNGDFELGETAWAFSGVTHAVNTNPTYVLEGTQSLRLASTVADHAQFAYAGWTHPAGGYPGGDYLTASAWVYVPSADYVGGAANDYSLVIIHRRAGTILGGEAASTIGDDFTFDEWVQLETGIGGVVEGDTIEVRLFPPHGVAYYDLVSLNFMESLSFGYPGPAVDVTDVIEGIVNYAQSRLAGLDHGKSDLNIDFTGTPTGITRQIAYQFEEHRNILDAIMEYVRAGYCDIDIALTPTTRTFTVHAPRKGSLYGTILNLGDVTTPGNLADFTFSEDLENAASSVVLLGPGDGPDRPEGGAIDTSFVGGAFTAEIVESAPDDATVGQLDARAAERLITAARPEILEVTTLPGAGVIGALEVGDTVPVVISHGWLDIDDTYRATRIEADLLKDQATLTLNALP